MVPPKSLSVPLIVLLSFFHSLLPSKLKLLVNKVRLSKTFISWRFSKNGYLKAKSELSKYKNKYTGHRCIIIGNGPSLNDMDLSLLKNEYTFGLNRIYLLFNKLNYF